MNDEFENRFDVHDYDWKPDLPHKQKKEWTVGKIIALALVCAVLGGAVGATGVVLGTEL